MRFFEPTCVKFVLCCCLLCVYCVFLLDVILLLTKCCGCDIHRPSEYQELKLCINHVGRFVTFPVKLYVEGCAYEREDNVDVDMLNYEDIKKLVLSFGYLKIKCL